MMINKENAGKVTVEAALQIIIIPLPVTMNRKIKINSQMKFWAVTVKQQIKLVLQHSLYK